MHITSISSFRGTNQNSGVYSTRKKVNSLDNSPKSDLRIITFTGKRYVHQIADTSPECTGTGLPEMAQGGEGVVDKELGESLIKYEKVEGKPVDLRRFWPIWNHSNPNGGHKFLIHKGVKTEDLPDRMPANMFVSGLPGQTKEEMAKALHLNVDEIDYVIQSRPNGDKPTSLSRYNILEPTSVSGTVKFPSTKHIGEMEEVPYQLMRLSEHNPSYVTLAKRSNNYYVYTPELARTAKPYSYDQYGNTPFEAEIISSNEMRAVAEIIENKMDTEEFNFYKPASAICHDRPSSSLMVHVANMSARGHKELNGLKMHKVEHNPSWDYQGHTYDPVKMMAVVGDDIDMQELRQHPQFPTVQKVFYNGGFNSPDLPDIDKQIARGVIEPFVAPFRDYFGTYNITKMPIVGVQKNPKNMSLGSVSWHFDAEMRSMETPDAAKGLTGDYASIETKPVANGVTIANLRFDERDAQFGRGDNGLSLPENTKNFTPFKYDGTNIEEVLEAKNKNAKWLTNLLWEAGQKGFNEGKTGEEAVKIGQDALNRLVFNEDQIKSGHTVMGYLSPLKDGEIVLLGLGRADTQKGYPITTGSILHFFKREDVPKELKLKTKFIVGGGPWNENHPHYQAMIKDYKAITELDGGIFKHNVMLNLGFTPNRWNACTHFGNYTSMYEMFGITPIEGKASGSPSSVTGTGGFLDYTQDGVNGFTTKDVVMGAPEKYRLTYQSSPQEIEQARINHQIPQVSDNYKRMIELYTNDRQGYIEMCKKNIEEEVDWHNNSAYNHGKSANRRYLDVIFDSENGWGARSKKTMKRLVGKFGEAQENLENMANRAKFRPAKIALLAAVCILAAGSGLYMYMIHHKNHQQNTPQEKQPVLDEAA